MDLKRDQLYNFARDRDKALTALGPRIFDTVVPGLSRSVPTTGTDAGSLSYQHLLASGNKKQLPVVLTPSCPERKDSNTQVI